MYRFFNMFFQFNGVKRRKAEISYIIQCEDSRGVENA